MCRVLTGAASVGGRLSPTKVISNNHGSTAGWNGTMGPDHNEPSK